MTAAAYPLTTVAETGQKVMFCGLARDIVVSADSPMPEFRVEFLDAAGVPHILFDLNPATGLLLIEHLETLSRKFRWKQRSLLKRPPKAPKGEGSEPRPTLVCGEVVNAILAVIDLKLGRPALILEFNDPKSPIPGAEFEIEIANALQLLKGLKHFAAKFEWQRLLDEAHTRVAARGQAN